MLIYKHPIVKHLLQQGQRAVPAEAAAAGAHLGRHYLSKATCLIRPHLLYARITIVCQMVRHV